MNILYSDDFNSIAEIEAIITTVLITILISVLAVWYWFQLRKKPVDEELTGFLLLFTILLQNIEKIVVGLLGKKYAKLSPYFLLLFLYINLGNFATMFLGLETPFSFLTVVLSLGLITFLGIYYFGLVFEGWSFFKRYINPLEFVSQITSFISISFRLFGNILTGIFILSLIYSFLMNSELGKTFKWFNFLAVFVAPLHFYFDVFSGSLHSFIFILLTMIYWSLSRPPEVKPESEKVVVLVKK